MTKRFAGCLLPVLFLLGSITGAAALRAQGWDSLKTPATPVPSDRWGSLQPVSILGDTSWWNFGTTPDSRHPAWHDLDIENGWIFATSGRGLMVYDGGSNPEHPLRWGYFYASTATVPDWHQNDTKYYLMGVDAPAGYDGVAAVAAISNNGMLIFDTRSRQPELKYQDDSKEGRQVWATTVEGTHYAFFGAATGVLVYNLSAAQSLTATCLDESPASTPCMDGQGRKVYVGRIATQSGAGYVHGSGEYLAVSLGTLGVEIWRVSDPASPEKVLSFVPSGDGVEGVALWQEGASYYLGLLQKVNDPPRYLRIFDVSCVTAGCSGPPPEVGAYAMTHAPSGTMFYLSFSRAGAVPFLYVGGEDQFSGSPQREYLLDVSDPTDPVEVTPQVHPDGYWGWYYAGNSTGFNWVMPRAAKFNGNYLVRAAFGLLDVHEYRGDLPPAAVFTYSPPAVYAGDAVDFTDRSTGSPSSWSWIFAPDGIPAASTIRSPQDVVFATPGAKTVTLAINGGGATKTQTLQVLDPQPAVGGVTMVPASPKICQRVTFTGQSIAGKPPLTLAWQILDANGRPLPGVSGNAATFDWTATGNPVGSYTARLTAINSSGGAGATASFNLVAPGPLPLEGQFTPSHDPFTAATVLFHLPAGAADSAAEWKWDFGDGSATGWQSDPDSGPNPTHTYAAVGSYTVKVSVRNCVEHAEAGIASAGLPVTISRLTDDGTPVLAAIFHSDICAAEAGLCQIESGVEATFTDASTGDVVSQSWDFGDGATAAGSAVTHTWQKAGTYALTLTVSDGTSSVSATRNVIVTGPAVEAMVIPWVGKTVNGALVQSSDVYLHNPGTEAMDVTLELRRRGLPEESPPSVTRTIAPNATLYAADAVQSLFGREDVTGFLAVRVAAGSVQPVLTSFHTTFQEDGSELGQTIPGFRVSDTGAASTTGGLQIQHLVGLSDNSERFAYFGVSNPGAGPVSYRLRFFDHQGSEIGAASAPILLSPYAAKQYQVRDIRTLFGISGQDDYRVVVESAAGAPLFPYAANLRLGTGDPSYVAVGAGTARVFLVGALSTPGLNDSLWQSDLVIANPGDQAATVTVTFTGAGAATQPTAPVQETLAAGETRRLADLIGSRWSLRNAVGVLTVDSTGPGGAAAAVFPIVQGESYDNTNPARRYGQTLPALTEAQAAAAGQGQYLTGLRQDTKHRTTLWVFNPGTLPAVCEIVYRALDGQELGRAALSLGAGKLRQINPGQLPAGVEGGFTAQVLVTSGKVLTAAQVVNNRTNDPAYIRGETR